MDKLSPTKAIKTFFESDGGRTIGLKEMMSLSRDERIELGALSAEKLGVELEVAA